MHLSLLPAYGLYILSVPLRVTVVHHDGEGEEEVAASGSGRGRRELVARAEDRLRSHATYSPNLNSSRLGPAMMGVLAAAIARWWNEGEQDSSAREVKWSWSSTRSECSRLPFEHLEQEG